MGINASKIEDNRELQLFININIIVYLLKK